MNTSRRNFIGGLVAGGAMTAVSGCRCLRPLFCKRSRVALQLYSIRDYIKKNGLAKSLAEVAKAGYEGVEFAGYWDFKPAELKKMLDDNGLVACGTHVGRDSFSPEKFAATCEFELGYGNNTIICPGDGNMPPGASWDDPKQKSSQEIDDFIKKLCDYYNEAAGNFAKYGCSVGLHNHQWEFFVKMQDGTSYWDYFFTHTDNSVLMEQDVGWTTCAGFDPCEQYLKYPHRSRTLHAKENGMGPNVKEFDAILGKPGVPGAVGVDWDRLFPITDADGVDWYVVECERHCDSFDAVIPSIEFLRSKGRA